MTTHLPSRFLGLLWLAFALALQASAQEPSSTAGSIRGQVIDSESAAPVEGVKVTVTPSAGAAAGQPGEQERVTDASGRYEFPELPAGSYSLKFTKSGYRVSLMTSFAVKAGELNRADFPLPPLPPHAAEEMPGFEEFVVEASPMEEILEASRMESDELLNTLNAAEFAKFAASDVADALKFVPGVNVVNGQFAIIRGLEDRYSSTLYNSAVVPSPDPNRQSVQLDLFPSDVVTNLVVSKTFAPDLPSNSSGGAINILTNDYPESFEFKLSGGSGFNSNANNDFLKYNSGSPMGTPTSGWNTAKTDYGFSLGGRTELAEREVRYKLVGGSEVKYKTQEGSVSAKEPAKAQTTFFPTPGTVTKSGDLAFGRLSLSDGHFDLNESERSDQQTAYGGFGFDLDPDGHHKIDATILYAKKRENTVQLYENGYVEGLDYGALAQATADGEEIDRNGPYFEGVATNTSWITRGVRVTPNDPIARGPLWSDSFAQSESFDVDRTLVVYQLNGDDTVDAIDGLHFSWAANTARTSQQETSLGARYFYEPTDVTTIPDTFPVTVAALGPGRFYANDNIYSSANEIHESQNFGRLDADYEIPVSTALSLKLDSGVWYERATRDVGSDYLEVPLVGNSSQYAISGDTALQLGSNIFPALNHTPSGDLAGVRSSTSDGVRELKAWNFGGKATTWDDLDLLAGARYESISIQSKNAPYTGELALDGSPSIFPTKYLFFDRLDNPGRGEVSAALPPGTTFNDQILGISVTPDPTTGFVDLPSKEEINTFLNGDISETRILPSLGFTYRAVEGMTLRGAYSQTVARPSFREMGFYVSVEPGSDDLVVGNPQLQLSDVTSYDLRTEYVWGELGDLAAISAFYKSIDQPIESIVVRDPLNLEGDSSSQYRTYFNNPSRASVRGIELEARKNLGFLGPDFAQYFSLGGNYTYIDATVDRTDAELERAKAFFPVEAGTQPSFTSYQSSRRLFGQPEWIASADLTFDNPDWGTKITLAFFGISEILDAAGSASIAADGSVSAFTLDQYLDSFTQLNLIASQTWPVGILGGDVTLKGNVKNLTDTTRRIIYDQDQTSSSVARREWKLGLDYSLSLTYSLSF